MWALAGSVAVVVDTWARQHSAARFILNRIEQNQKYFKWIQNSPNLTDPKGVFPCSKNQK
jgi:hypothetical protein